MAIQLGSAWENQGKISIINSLYLYSDLPVERIAQTVKMDIMEVRRIIDGVIRKNAIDAIYEQTAIPVTQIMEGDVAILDHAKTALDATNLMIQKGVGYVVVTEHGEPFGIVTERDILCETSVFDKRLGELSLRVIASRPIIYTSPQDTVTDVADLMMKHDIRRIPVVEDAKIIGIVVARDLALLMSSAKRTRLAGVILEAIARSRRG